MSHSFHQSIAHIVFSTKERRTMISSAVENRLHPYLGGIVREQGGIAMRIDGTQDHVHILAQTPKTVSDSDFMRALKANSSKWVHEIFPELRLFTWQVGYGWFSVSKSQVPKVDAYIANQKEHHHKMTFQEEFVELLKKHGIEFDERYIWE
jgi:putative transposase